MADYYYASIEFPLKALEIEQIAEEVKQLERDIFSEHSQHEGVYLAHANEARYGYFRELEDLLDNYTIPYKRTSGSLGDEAPTEVFSDPVDDVVYSWHLTNTEGLRLTLVDEVIKDLKKALDHEDDAAALQSAKEFLRDLEERYPNKEVSDFVTSFVGQIKPTHSIQITSDIKMYVVKRYRDQINYQCDVAGNLGLVYKTKPVYITIDGEERCTFFTEGGKQYWLHEMDDLSSISYGG